MATKENLLQVMGEQTRQQLELSIGMQSHIKGMLQASLLLTNEISGALEGLRAGKRPRASSGIAVLQQQPETSQARPIDNSSQAIAQGSAAACGPGLAEATGAPGVSLAAAGGSTTTSLTLAPAPSSGPCMSNSSTLWTSSLSSAACVGLSAAEEGPQGLAHAPSICSPFPRQLSSVSSMPCSPAHGLSMHSHSNGTVDATTTSSGHIVPKPTRASVFSPATYPQQHQQHQHPPQRPLLPPLPRLPPPPSPQYLPAGPAGHLASLQSSVSIASMAAPSKKRKSGRAAEPAAPTRAAVAASGRPSPPARRHVHHNRNHSQPRAPPGINNNSNGSSNGSSSGSTAAAATSAGTTSALAPLAAGFAPTAGLHPLVFANTYFSNPGVVAQLQAMQQAMKPGPSVAPAAAAASNVAVHVPSAPAAPAAAARVVVAAAPPAAALPARDAGYRTGPDLAPISAAGLLLGLESQEGAAAGGDAFMLRSDEMFGGVACDPWAQLFQD